MKAELLIASVNAEPEKLIEEMHLTSNAVIINQCDREDYREITLENGSEVRVFSYNERGVGKSRNHALEKAMGEIVLFGDEDIVYESDCADKLIGEFEAHPEADIIFFNIKVGSERQTYWNTEFKEVGFRNTGRYGIVSLAARYDKIWDLKFSELFGGGAKYSAGEDSLFIMDCLKKGLRCFASPVCLGEETPSESSWFTGYNDKFFFDRGVLYHFLYGNKAGLIAARFLLRHKSTLLNELSFFKAFRLMRDGIKEGKTIKKDNT